ncbi:MAG: NAD(P)-dependent oxidoreductase [Candidatus Thermoplasmatota archaeon]|nr:NAD(P)-dependent oxidoreductase [Candidatus Thermoplasmatota archaeon]
MSPPPPRLKRKFIPLEERKTTFKEPDFGYTREEAIEEAKRCIQCKKPACVAACPANAPAKDYVGAIAEGDFDKAYRLNRESLPIPCTLGRVCPAFCEAKCILGKKWEPVAIRDLKRAACDYGEHWSPTVEGDIDKKVAVIGAGPAGLTVAEDLTIKGYKVTVFDRLDRPGGTLVAGIPVFRLPRDVFGLDMQQIEDLGVEFKFNSDLGKDFNLDDLIYQGYDAVFIGIGATVPKTLGITGEDLKGVASASAILEDLAFEREVDLPDRISIIGCGNVAIDIARSAIRLGKEATILYRRTLKEAPANDDEIEEAFEEGVDIKYLVAPIVVIGDADEHCSAVECIRMELGEPDDSGRRRPVPIEASEFSVPTDMVIPAISQSPDLEWLKMEDGLELTRWSTFWVDEDTGATSRKGVFAAGDDVLGPATVVEAIAHSHVAADGIHRYLSPDAWERERRPADETPTEWPPEEEKE